LFRSDPGFRDREVLPLHPGYLSPHHTSGVFDPIVNAT
jgi:hypothetical protein